LLDNMNIQHRTIDFSYHNGQRIHNRIINFHYNGQRIQTYHMEQLSKYHCSTKMNESIKQDDKLKRSDLSVASGSYSRPHIPLQPSSTVGRADPHPSSPIVRSPPDRCGQTRQSDRCLLKNTPNPLRVFPLLLICPTHQAPTMLCSTSAPRVHKPCSH
jgi:hypothetical protein